MPQAEWVRSSIDFVSRGSRCAAWLYLPRAVARPPVVIMAHGFGAERTFGLEPFAERFAQAGLATFLFDYRCFGDSEGEPRNWISPRRHLQDWEAALAHVKSLATIDPSRIALWGTSFSGGHVIVLAARHPEISAVVAQVPFADGLALLTSIPLKLMPRLGMAALRDLPRTHHASSSIHGPHCWAPRQPCHHEYAWKLGRLSVAPSKRDILDECLPGASCIHDQHLQADESRGPRALSGPVSDGKT